VNRQSFHEEERLLQLVGILKAFIGYRLQAYPAKLFGQLGGTAEVGTREKGESGLAACMRSTPENFEKLAYEKSYVSCLADISQLELRYQGTSVPGERDLVVGEDVKEVRPHVQG